MSARKIILIKRLEAGVEPVTPFLKWPGGKRLIASRIAALVRERLVGRYFEPLLGGGAVFFHVRPQKAILSDANAELINTYRAVRDNTPSIISRLKRFEVSESAYYRIRRSRPDDSVTQAARFLYLNRTAFGGIYRLNRQGE